MGNANTNPAENKTLTEEQKEFARIEFFNWCDANEIDRGIEAMNDDDRKGFEKIIRHFTQAINEKRLVVDGDHITYTVSDKSPNKGDIFTVKRPNGRAMLAMDGFKETAGNQKLQNFMAAICGVEKKRHCKNRGT